jgi:hypothetical protein
MCRRVLIHGNGWSFVFKRSHGTLKLNFLPLRDTSYENNSVGTHGLGKLRSPKLIFTTNFKTFLEIIPAFRRKVQSVDISPLSYSGGPVFISYHTDYLTEVFPGFTQYFPLNVSGRRPRPLPATPFPIRYYQPLVIRRYIVGVSDTSLNK